MSRDEERQEKTPKRYSSHQQTPEDTHTYQTDSNTLDCMASKWSKSAPAIVNSPCHSRSKSAPAIVNRGVSDPLL
eukprot:747936-Hanusia_phi.AAC.1